MKKKIIYVVNVDWFFVSHRLPIALAAQKNGYEVHLATKMTNHSEILNDYNIKVHNVNFGRSSFNPIKIVECIIKLTTIFIKEKPSIAHLVTIGPVICGGIAARLARVPSVVVAISGLGYVFVNKSHRTNVVKLIIGKLYKTSIDLRKTIFIFQNNSDKDQLNKIINFATDKALIVKGSGVDLSIYRPFENHNCDRQVVIMASRLLKSKGVREYVSAARILQKRGVNADFYLAGEPDYESPDSISLDEYKSLKSEGCVKVLGHRTDMVEVLSSSNLVVFPSYYGEGLPKVLVEAAACGRAVITTDHPGCRDAILPGITGLLVAPRDVESLTDTISKLLGNPELLSSMGREGRSLACKEFSIEKIIDQHLDVYRRLIN